MQASTHAAQSSEAVNLPKTNPECDIPRRRHYPPLRFGVERSERESFKLRCGDVERLWDRFEGNITAIGRALGITKQYVALIVRALRENGVDLHDYHGARRTARLEGLRSRCLEGLRDVERELEQLRRAAEEFLESDTSDEAISDLSAALGYAPVRLSNGFNVQRRMRLQRTLTMMIIYPRLVLHAESTSDMSWLKAAGNAPRAYWNHPLPGTPPILSEHAKLRAAPRTRASEPAIEELFTYLEAQIAPRP